MVTIHWILLMVVLIAALTIWHWQSSKKQERLLLADGFTISEDFQGNPRLLVDLQQRELAIIKPRSYQRIPFSSIESVEHKFEQGVQVSENHRLLFTLKEFPLQSAEVYYEHSWRAEQQLEKLRELIH